MFKFKNLYNVTIIFIIIVLIEGYINHNHLLFKEIIPSESIYNTSEKYSKSKEGMRLVSDIIWEENGVIENIQTLFLFFSIIFFYLYLKKGTKLNFKYSKFLKYTFLAGLVYYFFEEISWGQHYFDWKSPYLFSYLNEQNETNLHNINNLFNQLPRNLILIWSSLTFLVIKFKFLNIHQSLNFFIYPSIKLKKISFLIIFFSFPRIFFENYLDLANIKNDNITASFEWNGKIIENSFEYAKVIFLDFVNFKFVRISELEELLFSYYILTHTYYLNKEKIE